MKYNIASYDGYLSLYQTDRYLTNPIGKREYLYSSFHMNSTFDFTPHCEIMHFKIDFRLYAYKWIHVTTRHKVSVAINTFVTVQLRPSCHYPESPAN